MVHFLNCMIFCVRVPVLSEKTYWIWPSSSFRVVVRACRQLKEFMQQSCSDQLRVENLPFSQNNLHLKRSGLPHNSIYSPFMSYDFGLVQKKTLPQILFASLKVIIFLNTRNGHLIEGQHSQAFDNIQHKSGVKKNQLKKIFEKQTCKCYCTLAGVSFSAKYICRSQLMNLLWPKRITSTL